MPKELNNDLEEQLKELDVLERRQALESRKIQDELARLQLADLRAQHETKVNNKKRGMEDAEKAIKDRASIRAPCNHHTGGFGPEAIHFGQGDLQRPTCIGAQMFLDDRIRLTCQRCNDECFSDDPDREKWAKWVELWKHSINQQMMVIGGLKMVKQQQVVV